LQQVVSRKQAVKFEFFVTKNLLKDNHPIGFYNLLNVVDVKKISIKKIFL